MRAPFPLVQTIEAHCALCGLIFEAKQRVRAGDDFYLAAVPKGWHVITIDAVTFITCPIHELHIAEAGETRRVFEIV